MSLDVLSAMGNACNAHDVDQQEGHVMTCARRQELVAVDTAEAVMPLIQKEQCVSAKALREVFDQCNSAL